MDNQEQIANIKLNNTSSDNQIDGLPLGVKIISIFFFILTGLFLVIGAFFILRDSTSFNYGESTNYLKILGVILICFSIFFTTLGIFLWKRSNLSRILTIIFSFFIAVILLFECANRLTDNLHYFYDQQIQLDIFFALSSILVFTYLSFSKKAKVAFNPQGKVIAKDILIASGLLLGLFTLFLFLNYLLVVSGRGLLVE